MFKKAFRVAREFHSYLIKSGKWWLVPVMLFFILISVFIVLTENSIMLPFVYTLF